MTAESQPSEARSAARSSQDDRALPKVLRGALRDRHFVIAGLFLLVATIGWGAAMAELKLALQKAAVNWPAGVKVDQEHRLTSFPERVGPYLIAQDGELERDRSGQPIRDGRPDGVVVFEKDLVQELGMEKGAGSVKGRDGCWYLSLTYRDTRATPGDPLRYWRIDVTYYTGMLDKVPHIAERCMAVAGAEPAGKFVTVQFPVEGVPEPWRRTPVHRTVWSFTAPNGLTGTTVQYYTFSLNGTPDDSWKTVRAAQASPFTKYLYFAKIQFAPRGSVQPGPVLKTKAEAFFSAMLPHVLETLPSPQDVENLEQSDS